MLKYTATIFSYGKSAPRLCETFQDFMQGRPLSGPREKVNVDMMKADVTKFNFTPDEKVHDRGFIVNIKKELYRFPSILLLDLSIVYNC